MPDFNPFVLDPTAYAQQQKLLQQQKLAEALQAQGMQPLDVNRSSGRYVVPVSPLEGLAKLVQTGVGAHMGGNIAEQSGQLQGSLASKHAQLLSAALSGDQDAMNSLMAAGDPYATKVSEARFEHSLPPTQYQQAQLSEEKRLHDIEAKQRGDTLAVQRFNAGLDPETGKPIDTTNLSPADENLAQAIYRGDIPAPALTGRGGAHNRMLLARAQEIGAQSGEPFSATKFNTRKNADVAFSKGPQGNALRFIGVATDHLGTLGRVASALDNGDVRAINAAKQEFGKQFGSTTKTDFDTIKDIVGSEVTKAVIGGAGALTDRQEVRDRLNAASTPKQLADAIALYQELMGAQRDGLKGQFVSSYLGSEDDFEKRFPMRHQQPSSPVGGTSIPQGELGVYQNGQLVGHVRPENKDSIPAGYEVK